MSSKVKSAHSLLSNKMGALRPGRKWRLHALFQITHSSPFTTKNWFYCSDVVQWCSERDDIRKETSAFSDVMSLLSALQKHLYRTIMRKGTFLWNLSCFSWVLFKVKHCNFMCHVVEIKSLPLNEHGKVEKSSLHNNSLNIWTVQKYKRKKE